MDRDQCINFITQFSTICSASPINNQILLFDRHGSHLDNHTLHFMEYQKNQPFFLKSGDYDHYKPNDNGFNGKLKSCYNDTKMSWMMNYGTTEFYLAT